jgi:signal transduction histidine kinase
MYMQAGISISPEILVPRIGEYLIREGYIGQEELQSALLFQTKRSEEGRPLLLGQALLEMGMITRETLDLVVTDQILELQNALKEANLSLQERVDERTIELRKALDRLSELNELKSNFIANISHELRTPLTHIKGYLDILGDGGLGPVNNDQLQAIQVLKKAESRLEHLIEDLIQFSLVSRGEISLSSHSFNLKKLVASAFSHSESKAKLQEIRLTSELPDDLAEAYGDEDKIGWVLLQLLDNAIKFTPKGGEVFIRAREFEGDRITCTVADTGIGIPAQKIGEIFEPFHQLDGSAARRYSGTGLGLSMVRRIVEAHGSQVRVLSKKGKGTQFTFDLPSNINSYDMKRTAGIQ